MTQIVISHFADSASGVAALGFDFRAFLIQIITFILALLVLKKYAFKPIVKVLNQRRETIENSVKMAEQIQKEEAEMSVKVDKTMQEARLEADGIIASAQDAARQTVLEAEEKARDKASRIVAEAEIRIKQDTARARQQLEKELVGLISDATEAIIDEKVDAKKDAQLIERALKERQTA